MNDTNNERPYIENRKITIYGKSGDKVYPRTFEIIEMIKSGGSAITYSADFNGKGILKEFFPLGFRTLSRDENEKPIYAGSEKEAFEKRLYNYIFPYHTMAELRRDENIAGFIPPFELYTGNEDGSGSVYIWVPQPKLKTFEELCAEIHERPDERPEYDLAQILYAIESLAECIEILHSKKLVHCDITPGNFGFLKRGGKILYDSISLFDIDTISYIYDKSRPIYVSKKFTAPEISGNSGQFPVRHNFSSDIYSIGAVLFCALLPETDSIPSGSFYRKASEAVERSVLISSSPSNSYPELKNILTKILKNTLCSRESRYESCGELLGDIRKALGLIVPAAMSGSIEPGKKWMLTDMEKYMDKNIISMAIQKQLYEYPLYMNVPHEKETIDLLIIGLDRYSGKLADNALQISHIPGKRLRVTIISDKSSAESFLKSRPELKNFFNIDGASENDAGSYGDINFIIHAPSADDPGYSKAYRENSAPDYIFISAGWDINLPIAKKAAADIPGCIISYACIKKPGSEKNQNILPVCFGEEINDEFSERLERMGFNTHLVWNSSLNIDFADKKREYRQAYNHESCLSFVLSIKYKLYGAGIDMDKLPDDEIIRRYKEYIADINKKNELVCLEHRRWVTEKICLGYTSIPDLNDCAGGRPKDETRKRHGCIVRCDRERRLSGGIWRNPDGTANHKAWNEPPEDEFEKLDPLEKMSVELHRVYKKSADKVSSDNLLNGSIVSEIRASIDGSIEAVSSFQELMTCMKDISNDENGSTGQHKLYSGLKKRFEKALKNSDLEKSKKEYVKKLSDSLAGVFYPVCASRSFHDYKEEDDKLIGCLPFILAYSENICMVIPYKSGSSTELFSNLAAPTIVNPGKVIYAVYCEKCADIHKIKEELPCITDYMSRKHLHGSVEFLIGIKSDDICDRSHTEDELKKAGGGKVKKVRFIEAKRQRDFAGAVKTYLEKAGRHNKNIFIEMRGLFESSGLFEDFSAYEYNGSELALKNINKCMLVEEIRSDTCITVNDMFSFRKAVSIKDSKPEFPDFMDIWQIYRKSSGAWKYLCGRLKEYSSGNDIIAVFRRKDKKAGNTAYTCLIPFVCRQAVQKILNALISEQIIGESSCITRYNTEICRINIDDTYGNRHKFDGLFSRPHILMNADYVSCGTNEKEHVVKVIFDDLCVNDLDCGSLFDAGFSILDYFRQQGYFINYTRKEKKISFTYASRQIKELLVKEGRLLEVYTYHSAYNTRAFGDIRSGLEVTWEGNIAKNELDCILTKGFSSVFIECKAASDIKKEHFMKLAHIVNTFGINAKAVMLIDAQDVDADKIRNLQKEFHNEGTDIITVYDHREIDDIGRVLIDITKGTYIQSQ